MKTAQMKTSLTTTAIAGVTQKLARANRAFTKTHPGETGARQPVHTVYGGAHLFTAGIARKLGDTALRMFVEYAPTPDVLQRALVGPGADAALWAKVHERVAGKLRREPVEDFRIDFEDGYGTRPDAEEDGHAVGAAEQVAQGLREGGLPPFLGIRIKPFSAPCFARSQRTLDLFVTTLAEATRGHVPENFVVTLPKVTIPEQVAALAALLGLLEKKHRIEPGAIGIELMVETPESIFDAEGASPLRAMVAAAGGRCRGAHFGTYDYTAGCGIVATYQAMGHPACDFAKHVMKVALSGSGMWLSDGATVIMPVTPHKASPDRPLTPEQKQANEASVHRAWRLAYDDVRHSLVNGYYQGWDLHPGQLPIRYAAAYCFFLEALHSTTERLRTFVDKAARATLLGDVFDDAATGQGLLNFFLRGMACGAIREDEALATGVTLDEFRGRSFVAILERRKHV
jgi:citrate lyase beta subunit